MPKRVAVKIKTKQPKQNYANKFVRAHAKVNRKLIKVGKKK